jgi:malonate-semialdehyde dehydrogenase (acetylating) / methylmalonate-semialdehyde dehydrogenase
MLKLHSLINEHAHELAQLIVLENGKNWTEALADVAKGNETIEYACSLPQLAAGRTLQVSSGGVYCRDERRPLGVVVSIVPFNFPFMVPMWTLPIALVLGNTMILKPSEKVPLTMHRVAGFMRQAGFPPGVFNMIQGNKDAVTALLQHEKVQAVTFVGSSPVASIVASTCRALNKRCTALGGAKNHLVALSDCDVDSAAADICVSFAGCAGQRCMAASVLLLVQDDENDDDGVIGTDISNNKLLDALMEKAKSIEHGTGPGQMGPVIDKASYDKIISYIEAAEQDGGQILVDGRACTWQQQKHGGGYWIGPTIILHPTPGQRTMCDEVFGPVLSVFQCSTWEQAIAVENASPFGNAASIYTTNGANADWFLERFRAGMLGVNIGIPGTFVLLLCAILALGMERFCVVLK